MNTLTIYTDGGSLNNPGKAAYAYVIYFNDNLIKEEGRAIGIATNNVAEFTGLIEALKAAKEVVKEHSIASIQVYSDSQLMVRQLNGEYKVKKSHLQEMVLSIRTLEQVIGVRIMYTHVLREKNTHADSLVKKALGR